MTNAELTNKIAEAMKERATTWGGLAKWEELAKIALETIASAGYSLNKTSLREMAEKAAVIYRCNCDLDNWEPNADTGHSNVCRVDHAARRWHRDGIPSEF